jgi:hypothetical protein
VMPCSSFCCNEMACVFKSPHGLCHFHLRESCHTNWQRCQFSILGVSHLFDFHLLRHSEARFARAGALDCNELRLPLICSSFFTLCSVVTVTPFSGQKNTAVLAMLHKVAANCRSEEFRSSANVQIPTDTTDFAKVLAKFDSRTLRGDEDDRDDGWDW